MAQSERTLHGGGARCQFTSEQIKLPPPPWCCCRPAHLHAPHTFTSGWRTAEMTLRYIYMLRRQFQSPHSTLLCSRTYSNSWNTLVEKLDFQVRRNTQKGLSSSQNDH